MLQSQETLKERSYKIHQDIVEILLFYTIDIHKETETRKQLGNY